ncbi:dipeptidase PepE [Candidatus Gottesmanbacteria bacterium]|nr:dipeptidase PepE [Candidatus Gottesmanbacteria bacterium]
MKTKRLLLISNSKPYNGGYLDHVETELKNFLEGCSLLLFVPFALKNLDGYMAIARDRFSEIGISLTSVHEVEDAKQAVSNAEAIFIGGGNTFRLLYWLYQKQLINTIRDRALSGMPYIGTSAGANVACPTIKTTNDMPIIYPPSFDALNLVSFQINPHYIDVDPNSKHMGETREQRLKEFHEENETPVIGLREGSWLRVEGSKIQLKGTGGAKLFIKEKNAVELKNGVFKI